MFSRDKLKPSEMSDTSLKPFDTPKPIDSGKPLDVQPAKPRPAAAPKAGMPSIVSEGLHISGNLFSDGDLQIDGRIDGDIQGRNVTVGAAGTVTGKITADEVIVSGNVSGEIHARSVQLSRTAKVQSDLTQETLMIEAGALFEGTCRRPGTSLPKSLQLSDLSMTTPILDVARPKVAAK
jgi:cytoskeletal protein CcmA (bactofilin family)